ncbi:hypothetical protein SNE40_012468 [Patella caerulea]|uniref:Transmembrane protein 244 n=1 Tax=Patella caerulea TaxID=87958 RepID=A0AAN8PMP9_PATCE
MGELSTKAILINTLKCFVVFYGCYYVVSSVCYAFYRLSNFDGRIPFNFKTWVNLSNCCTGYTDEEMVNVISMEVSYSLCGIIYGLLVRNWAWDYAVSIALLHLALSCLVMLDFPVNWSWWVCYGCALLLKIILGEMVCFLWKLKRKVKVEPGEIPTQKSYLYHKM